MWTARPAVVAALVGALGFVVTFASACSTTPWAATVGSTTISQSSLIAEVRGYEASPLVNSGLSKPPSQNSTTVPTQVAAGLLKNDIAVVLEKEILSSKGERVTPEEIQLARRQIESQIPGGQAGHYLTSNFENYLVQAEATSLALESAVGGIDLSRRGLIAYFDAHRSLFEKICFQAAVYSQQSDAQAARDAIARGTPFSQATSGAQGGTGPTPSCGSPASAPPVVQQALLSTPPGQVGPVTPVQSSSPGRQSSTGYAVFVVTSVEPVAFDSALEPTIAASELQSSAQGSLQARLFQAVRSEALATKIAVNPADGTFVVDRSQPLGFTVNAPGGLPASELPLPAPSVP